MAKVRLRNGRYPLTKKGIQDAVLDGQKGACALGKLSAAVAIALSSRRVNTAAAQ